jgi:hypothetical protein
VQIIASLSGCSLYACRRTESVSPLSELMGPRMFQSSIAQGNEGRDAGGQRPALVQDGEKAVAHRGAGLKSLESKRDRRTASRGGRTRNLGMNHQFLKVPRSIH